MTGEYDIIVTSKRLSYNIKVKRNITILRGDSATGKTTLVNMIEAYYNDGRSSGVKVTCDKECRVLKGKNWLHDLELINDSIIFIDEGNKFITSHEFAKAIENTNNYYIIITRQDLDSLPYSVSEIYGMECTSNKVSSSSVYNTTYMIYGENITSKSIIPDIVITEDSNAGNEFFKDVCSINNIICKSAKGKSNIKKLIGECNKRVVIIADGAAFGNEISDVIKLLNIHKNYALYLPESFEWLILKSGIIHENNIYDILNNTCKYVDSSKYFSWERYFTWLLGDITSRITGLQKYNKNKSLPKVLKTPKCILKVLSQIRGITFY